jgi:threonine/homoserine/homoserine lactone efflux protein
LEIEQWLKIAFLCALGAMSPGPSLAVIVNNTLSGGKSAGIYTSILHGIGVGSYALLVITSTSLTLQRYAFIESILEIAGAGLLCWLSVQSWPKPPSMNSSDQLNTTSVLNGLLIVIFNPKITIFFLAIFSPSLGTIFGWQNWLGIAVMVGVIDAVWYILVVLVASTSLLQMSGEIWRKRIGKIMSIVMALIALEIFIKHLSSFV